MALLIVATSAEDPSTNHHHLSLGLYNYSTYILCLWHVISLRVHNPYK